MPTDHGNKLSPEHFKTCDTNVNLILRWCDKDDVNDNNSENDNDFKEIETLSTSM